MAGKRINDKMEEGPKALLDWINEPHDDWHLGEKMLNTDLYS